jgi:hypothetical protein
MGDRADFAEPGPRDPHPGSPLFAFAIVGVLLLIALLPLWGFIVVALTGPID